MNRRDLLLNTMALAVSPAVARGRVPITEIANYERDSGGRIGLFAENLHTGAKISWRAHERFVMCSTFKASLAAWVLTHVDGGKARMDEMITYGPSDIQEYAPVAKQNLEKGAMSVDAMCEAAVELSDNTCANLLLARFGGPSALTSFWRTIGDSVSRLDHNEPQLNRSLPGDPHDTTTPVAMAGTLRRLIFGEVLSSNSRERFTHWLIGCKTGDKRLRAGLPKNWRVGDKTGNNGKDAFGDIAVAWSSGGEPILICAYTQGGSPTLGQIETLFAGIGRFVGMKFSQAG